MGARHIALGAFAGLAMLALAGCGNMMQDSGKVNMTASLSGAQEVPAVAGAGKGSATVTLDKQAKTLSWNLAYSGLSGPAAAAHFHGPAAPGANAGVVLPIKVSESPMTGTATLTDAQITDLLGGKWYLNIHTAANKGGEIRGQVTVSP